MEIDTACDTTKPDPKRLLTGNRVVDIAYFIEHVRRLAIHDSRCTMGKMVFSNLLLPNMQ